MQASRRIAIVASAALIASCDETIDPNLKAFDAGAALIEAMSNEQFSALGMTWGGTPIVNALPVETGACTFNEAISTFQCEPQASYGATWTRSYQLFDVLGRPTDGSLGAIAPIDAIRLVSELSVNVTYSTGKNPVSTTVVQTSTSVMTVSGLLGDTHVLNGSIVAQGTRTTSGTQLVYSISQTTEDVELAGASAVSPRRGSIVTRTWADVPPTAAPTMQTEFEFNGTSTLALTTISGGVTEHKTCTINTPPPIWLTCL